MRAIAKQVATDAECGQGNPGSNLEMTRSLASLREPCQVSRMRNVALTLSAAREERGWSIREVRDLVLPLLGRYTPTEQTISQYHKPDNFPAKPDLTLLFALARVYRDLQLNAKKPRARWGARGLWTGPRSVRCR